MLIKFAAIVLLGAPVVAVVIFEVLLNATAMFNHGNVRIPRALDRALRWLLVTPDMHRVHHSVTADETNSNFGFNLPWWDRLFGTYPAPPRARATRSTAESGQRAMRTDSALRIAAFALLAAGTVAALIYRGRIDAGALQEWASAAGLAAPLLFIVAYAAATVLFFPGSIL